MDLSPADAPDRRHIIPDRQYIEEYANTISEAFLELAASVEADELDRIWFQTRVADSIEHIRNCRVFEVERSRGTINPSPQEVAQNQEILADSRKEIFAALQDLIHVTRYLFLRET